MKRGLFLTIFAFTPSAHARTEITTCSELQAMRENLAEDYVLGSNIDCTETTAWNSAAGFAPIGNLATPFTGSFDGNQKKINGLFINRPSTDYVGLFGDIDTGVEISNVGLEDININGDGHVGGLVGHSDGTVTNSYSTGVLEGIGAFDLGIGGLVGTNSGTIRQSFSTVNVTATIDGGGLVGTNFGTVANSYATGSVHANDYAGGITGFNGYDSDAIISKSYSTGAVTGSTHIGGMSGGNASGVITNSFWDTETSGQGSSFGGTGKTSSEMKVVVTFTDTDTDGLSEAWDFVDNPNDDAANNEYWDIDSDTNSGYPHLAWWPFPDSGGGGGGGGGGGQGSDNDDPSAFLPPEIFQPIQTVTANKAIRIKAQIQRSDAMKMMVTINGKQHRMYDDGKHGDNSKGDLIYATNPLRLTKSADYTITTYFFEQVTKIKGKVIVK